MPKLQNFTPRTAPLPHQVEAIDYVEHSDSAALFDEQGLGKTKIVIDAFSRLMAKGEIEAVLIVAPVGLLHTWQQEVRKHSHLVAVVLRGSKRERKYGFLSGANFYIANYEAVLGATDIFCKMCESRRFAIALDESTRIKDPTTQTARALLELAKVAKRRVIMTGTPIANRPQDLWSQFFFLDGGEALGEDFAAFRARFKEDSPDYRQELDDLSQQIRQRSIRRLKRDVLELPDKVYISHSIPLLGEQKAIYDTCSQDLLIEIQGMTGEDFSHEIDSVLEKLVRLVQIASNPGLINPHYGGPCAKLEMLDELVPKLLSDHEKIVVWSCFVDNVEAVARRFPEFHPVFIHGGVDIDSRNAAVDAIQDSDSHRILVANPAAAREGLTLTRASAAVYLDRNFSLVDYLQSQDRIHRIGQTRECQIHKLVAADTIDEYVDLMIDLKQTVGEHVYRPSADNESRIDNLIESKAVLIEMLGGRV